jgi:hypothetical protein
MVSTSEAAPRLRPTGIRPSVTRRLASPERWLVALGGVVAALAHIPVIAPHLAEAPYMGLLFVLLTVACTAIALAVLVRDTAAVYALAVVACGLAVIGYAATRLVAFPMLADDVGNWLEPLGVVSVISEAIVVLAALTALLGPGRSAPSHR